jgi:hypothetical protein
MKPSPDPTTATDFPQGSSATQFGCVTCSASACGMSSCCSAWSRRLLRNGPTLVQKIRREFRRMASQRLTVAIHWIGFIC